MGSLIAWIGGKKQLRAKITELIPDDIKGYVEPFGGAGWVLFYKDRWANIEVYNDKDDRLVNLFRCVKYHAEELQREMEFLISSRTWFKEYIDQSGLTDIQKAARFLFLLKRSFGAQGGHFGTASRGGGAAFSSHKNIVGAIKRIHNRLDKVVIENLDYKKIFEIYDNGDNFFYCDSPYRIGAQYKVGRMDYDEYLIELKKLKGRFLLSIDDCPENRKLFKDFKIKSVSRVNGINRKKIVNNNYKELFVMNY